MMKISESATFLDLKNLFENGRDYIKKDFDFCDLVKHVEAYGRLGEIYTLYDVDGDSLAIFGAFVFKEKRASVWCVAAKDIEVNKFAFFKSIKKKLDAFITKNNIVKVEAYVRVDDSKALNFLSRLGFAIEGKQLLGAKDYGDLYYMGKVIKQNG